MIPLIFKGKGPCPFLPPKDERLDPNIDFKTGLKDFWHCTTISRNVHYIGFNDPSPEECWDNFKHACSYACHRTESSKKHLQNIKRCYYNTTTHPWEFKPKYTEMLKAEGRIMEKTERDGQHSQRNQSSNSPPL